MGEQIEGESDEPPQEPDQCPHRWRQAPRRAPELATVGIGQGVAQNGGGGHQESKHQVGTAHARHGTAPAQAGTVGLPAPAHPVASCQTLR